MMAMKELLTFFSEYLFTEETQPEDIICYTELGPPYVRESIEGTLKVNRVDARLIVQESNGMTYISLSCPSSTSFHFTLLNEDLNADRLAKMVDASLLTPPEVA